MSQPNNIASWLQGLPIPWLVGRTNGQADAGAVGSVLDDQVALMKEAIKARFPEEAPADALPYIGSERGQIQYDGANSFAAAETDDAFATRLRGVWDVWPYAGTMIGLMLELYLSLRWLNFYLVTQNGLIYSFATTPDLSAPPLTDFLFIEPAMALAVPAMPAPTPLYTKIIPAGTPWWRFDDKTDFCSRFAIVWPSLPPQWTDVQNPPTPTSSPTNSEINTALSIIQKYKNAEATFMGIYVPTSGKLWGVPPNAVWGAATGNWGGTSVVFI